MTADSAVSGPAGSRTTVTSLPQQSRRRDALSATDRLVRQVQGIDAWVAARRAREQALHVPGLSRDQRMDVAREVEVLRRTHDAIKGRCARGLDEEIQPMRPPGVTAVIAHRQAWFADRLTLFLGGHGVTVLVCTDNAAEALGAVVAEQPDVVLVGDRLAMMPARRLLAQTRRYAPSALVALQASDQAQAHALRGAADTVFLRHHSPAVIADALVAPRAHAAAAPADA